jgi:hypothetical protein
MDASLSDRCSAAVVREAEGRRMGATNALARQGRSLGVFGGYWMAQASFSTGSRSHLLPGQARDDGLNVGMTAWLWDDDLGVE